MGYWRICRDWNDSEETGGQKKQKGNGWLLGLLVGSFFLWAGASRGELAVIWRKAVMICMECIGIG